MKAILLDDTKHARELAIKMFKQNGIDLDVSDVELLSYFKQSKFKFKLSGFTTAPIDHVFEVKIGLTVKFEGEVIK